MANGTDNGNPAGAAGRKPLAAGRKPLAASRKPSQFAPFAVRSPQSHVSFITRDRTTHAGLSRVPTTACSAYHERASLITVSMTARLLILIEALALLHIAVTPGVMQAQGKAPAKAAKPPVAKAAATPAAAARQFDALVQHHLLQRAKMQPEWATAVGIHSYNSRLNDRRAAAFARDSAEAAKQRASLAAIDTTKLDVRRRIDWLLLAAVLDTRIHDAARRDWQRRPGVYVPFDAVYRLAVGTSPGPAARMGALTNRLRQWPEALAAGRRQIVAERTPKFWVELDAGSASRISRYLRTELPELVKKQGGNTAAFRTAVTRAANALDSYAAWMRDTLAPVAAGEWQAGEDEYNWRLANSKLLPTTAGELVAMGHRVFDETERSLDSLARTIDPNRTWRELADSSKNLHPHADSVLAAYSAENARARAFIIRKKLFTVPPGERLQMVLTPPNLRQTYAYGGYSSAAPFEKTQVGRFFVTPVEEGWTPEQIKSKLRGHNYGWITVVALHEGYPGHHLQNVRAAKQQSILRKVYGSDVFGEGWGLYAEELMYQNGFYPSPLARLTQLRMRLWRAGRVIIDPSIHTGRMTYDEAVSFFVDSVGLERSDAVAEVTRYTTWPTQAVSYILGMQAIESLRDEVKARMGKRFDLTRFHDVLLEQGSLPPPLMRRAVFAALKLD